MVEVPGLYPWQREVWRKIAQAREQQRLPHALLLAGPAGMGKAEFAAYLAHSLLCAQAHGDGAPCGQCKACHLLRGGNHPDLIYVRPEAEGKAIRVDQIRALGEFFNLTANYDGYQIAVLAPAEAMNVNASNSLLKLLEEPPPQSLLVLVSHQPSGLLATVRSRCQRLDFRPERDAARDWLAGRLGGRAAEADLLLELSAQAPLAALALLENLPKRHALFTALDKLLRGQAEPVGTAAEWVKLGTRDVLAWMISWTMDLVRARLGGTQLVNRDWQKHTLEIAPPLALRHLFAMLDLQLECYRLAQTSNVKEQGLLETVALRWLELGSKLKR